MTITYRKATPYVVMCRWVTRDEIPQQLPQLIGEVRHWLTKKSIEPAGAPFFEYRVMQGERMHVCVGFPVTDTVEGDEQVHAGAFPEGVYAGTRHVGAYDGLYKANEKLNEWFAAEGYEQRFLENSDSVRSGSRTEFYLSDPLKEQDPKKWQTDIEVWVTPV